MSAFKDLNKAVNAIERVSEVCTIEEMNALYEVIHCYIDLASFTESEHCMLLKRIETLDDIIKVRNNE